jgi:predicted secreted protein
MNAIVHASPARIVKRAEVSATLAHPAAPAAQAMSAAPAALARHFAKEARLVPGVADTATVDVRCSCGEWTRIELGVGRGTEAAR